MHRATLLETPYYCIFICFTKLTNIINTAKAGWFCWLHVYKPDCVCMYFMQIRILFTDFHASVTNAIKSASNFTDLLKKYSTNFYAFFSNICQDLFLYKFILF